MHHPWPSLGADASFSPKGREIPSGAGGSFLIHGGSESSFSLREKVRMRVLGEKRRVT
jgi:hypothetical protein